MIKLNTKRAAMKRGVKTPYGLAQRLANSDGKPPAALRVLASRLWRPDYQADLATIDRLAEALGDCDLCELLVRTPNKRKRVPAPPNGNGNGHRLKTTKPS